MHTPFQILASETDGSAQTFSVELDSEHVEQRVTERLQQMARTSQIKGFRRGKAPLRVLRNHHGRKLTEAIVDRMAISVARSVISEQKLRPVGRPAIDISPPATGKDVGFTLRLELYPVIDLQPMDGFCIEEFIVDTPEAPGAPSAQEMVLCRQHLKRQVFDQLMEQYSFSVPASIVAQEYSRISQIYRESVDPEIASDLDRQFEEIAVRRIRLAMLLVEVGREHDIAIPREEVERLVEAQAERDPEHEEAIVNFYLEHPSALAELQSTLFEDRVVDYILQQATLTQRSVSPEELQAIVVDA